MSAVFLGTHVLTGIIFPTRYKLLKLQEIHHTLDVFDHFDAVVYRVMMMHFMVAKYKWGKGFMKYQSNATETQIIPNLGFTLLPFLWGNRTMLPHKKLDYH